MKGASSIGKGMVRAGGGVREICRGGQTAEEIAGIAVDESKYRPARI